MDFSSRFEENPVARETGLMRGLDYQWKRFTLQFNLIGERSYGWQLLLCLLRARNVSGACMAMPDAKTLFGLWRTRIAAEFWRRRRSMFPKSR